MTKVLLVLLVAGLLFWFGARWGYGRSVKGAIPFVPVAELSAAARRDIDEALAAGRQTQAVRAYRSATGAPSASARAAIEIHRRRSGQ